MRRLAIILSAAGLLLLPACADSAQTVQDNPKRTAGGIGGALLGGYLGSKVGKGSGQLLATGAGALLGTYLGSEIGASLDRADRIQAEQAYARAEAAPIGETITWNNPESGNYGSVTPMRDGRSATGSYCREYQQSVTIDGQEQRAHGTVCQDPDGTWEIVS